MRALVYNRKSTDDGGRSVDQQNAANLEACSRYGWEVAEVYVDPDRSASRFAATARPDWLRLRERVRALHGDWVVVAWESSRGSREMEDWAGFLNDCRKSGVKVFITWQDKIYDVANARDRRSLIEDGSDSEYESEKISFRTRRGLATVRAEGRPVGRCPYGYVRHYDPVTRAGTQDPEPLRAGVVRSIVEDIAGGVPVNAVVRRLSGSGIPNPGGGPVWARKSITDIVNFGWCYIGKYRDGSDAGWPAIVEPAVWYRARAVLAGNVRSGARPGRAVWLLSYLARCHCGAPLCVKKLPQVNGGRPLYRCSVSRAGCMWDDVDHLDGLVANEIIRYLADPERYAQFTRSDDQAAQSARDEAASERARLETFTAQAISATISAATFAKISAGIEAHIAELEATAVNAAMPPVLASFYGLSTGAYRRGDLLARWEDMSLAAKRSLISAVSSPVLHSEHVAMHFVT